MQSGKIGLGTATVLAATLATLGCDSGDTSGSGGGTTNATTGGSGGGSSTGGAGGSATSATATGTGGAGGGSTGTGGSSCPFTSAECEQCLRQSCSDTQCALDPACQSSFDAMRTGCACTAQVKMDKNAEGSCIGAFAVTQETGDQIMCVIGSCASVCYLP